MIPIGIPGAFVIYLLVWFLTLTILWGRELMRASTYDWAPTKDHFCICESCHLVFSVKPDVNITRCPRCNEMCILRSKNRRL